MRKYVTFLCCVILLQTTNAYATTWDEPWADNVIKEATSFILGKVIASHPEKGFKVVVLKTLSGNKLTDTLTISHFYALKICSMSGGHGAEFYTLPSPWCVRTHTTGL